MADYRRYASTMAASTWTRRGVPAKIWRFLKEQDAWVSQSAINEFMTQFNEQYGRRWRLGWRESGAKGDPFPTLNLLHIPTGQRYEYYLYYDDGNDAVGPLYDFFAGSKVV